MRKLFYLISSIVLLASCSTTQKATDNNEASTTWQDVLRMWSETYDINDDAQRMAVIDQIISVFDMIDDTTITAEQLEEPICKMKETIEHIIDTDGYFEFVQMMRATARNIAGRMPVDNRLLLDCVIELMMIDCRWQTFSDDTLDFMGTSLFYNSWQALGRKVNIIFFKSDNDENVYAEMIFTNLVDTAMDNLSVLFLQDRDTLIALTNDDILYVDNSDAYAGVKRALVSPSFLIDAMLSTNTIIISYDTPNEHIEYISYPQIHFEEQVKKCPRLKKIVDQMIDDIEILK